MTEPVVDTMLYPDHQNDIGDWCPFSGEPVTTEDRCPQGCRSSAVMDDSEDEDDEDAIVVGGDGIASHASCNPNDALGDLSGPEGKDCWICGEELA